MSARVRAPLKSINIQNRIDIAKEFFWYVRSNFKTNAEAARHFNVSHTTLSYIVNGKQDLKPRMVDELGYELTYVKKADNNDR
tara:strand:- start:9292 stop:9540 length:249 start_codon:yes stop_codon:yes gene_type:complete